MVFPPCVYSSSIGLIYDQIRGIPISKHGAVFGNVMPRLKRPSCLRNLVPLQLPYGKAIEHHKYSDLLRGLGRRLTATLGWPCVFVVMDEGIVDRQRVESEHVRHRCLPSANGYGNV